MALSGWVIRGEFNKGTVYRGAGRGRGTTAQCSGSRNSATGTAGTTGVREEAMEPETKRPVQRAAYQGPDLVTPQGGVGRVNTLASQPPFPPAPFTHPSNLPWVRPTG